MARIRTIKPEFFSSDDICSLSPRARLLYIGLWCEADREGRLVWAPRVFKRRYLPDDDCDINSLCSELTARGLVVLYGDGLAFIPTFATHQHVNPREQRTKLPAPPDDASSRVEHASSRVSDESAQVSDASPPATDAQVGKEGEGKEGEGARAREAIETTLPDGWCPNADDLAWAKAARADLTDEMVANQTERFRHHQRAKKYTSHDWSASWRGWLLKAAAGEALAKQVSAAPAAPLRAQLRLTGAQSKWTFRLMGHRPGAVWPAEHGPAPESDQDNPNLDDDQRRQWRRYHGLPAEWGREAA